MARSSGRGLVVERASGSPATFAVIKGVRTKNPTVTREPIDVTTDDDAGWRTLLAEPGQRQIDLSFSGITEDETLIAAIMSGASVFETIRIIFPTGGRFEGDFFFNNLSLTGEYNNAVTFEGEMQSSGEITYTPPA